MSNYRRASALYTFFYPNSAYKYNEEQRKAARKDDDVKLKKVYGLIFEIQEHDFALAGRTLMNDRDRAKQKSITDYLPLHLAVYERSPYELIELLIDAYPQALRQRDPKNHLPIHIASRDDTVLLSIIQLIIKWWPDSLHERDPNDDLPVHMTIRHRLPTEITTHMLDIYPQSKEMTDKDGNTLLHMAVRFRSNYDFIMYLLRIYPDAINRKNNAGDLPFHRACIFNASLDLLTKLYEMNTKVLKVADKEGNLPIHLYFMQLKGAAPNEEILHFFVEPFPESIGKKNKQGHTPFAILDNYHEMLGKYKC
jgi:ankyrin repeat protein